MKHSLSFYLTILIIKLKGIKKNFSKDPIDYKTLRKEDQFKPKGKFFKNNKLRSFKIKECKITEVGLDKNASQLTIFIHGGAYVSGPAPHHWDAIKEIAKSTNHKIWMCDYPKAPENQIEKISDNIDQVYQEALQQFQSDKISLIGDSVGGALIAALTQRLVKNNFPLPNKIILVSPVMDASMTNPTVNDIEVKDPMLSKKGLVSAKKMCAGNLDLKNPLISPLFGSFENFPPTILYLAENDITFPDQQLALEKLKKVKVNLKVIEGKEMPHIWPFLPVMKEATLALNEIINHLKG